MPGEDEILDNSAVEVSDEEEPVVDQSEEEEVEASEPDKRMVDYRALREERSKRKDRDQQLARQSEQLELMRLQMMRLQEYANQNQGGNGQNLSGLDPEIQKSLAPYLEPIIEPIQRELNQAKQLLFLQAQKAEAEEAIRTLEREFPEIDDYREDIAEFLEDMDDQERNRILSSPKALAKIGRQIQRLKTGDAQRTAQKVVNKRAKSESGQSANRSAPNANWQDMKSGSKEFQDYLRGLGWEF